MILSIRSSILILSLATLVTLSPATRAGMWTDERYDLNLRSSDSSNFFFQPSSIFLSHAGPAWLMNALPGSRLASFHSPSLFNRDGDRTESIYRYANDVGTLANPFNIEFFSNVSIFGGSTSAPKTSTVFSPDATLSTDYTHTATGNGNWNATGDWTPTPPAGGPNAVGDIVRFQGAANANTTQNNGSAVTVGQITLQGTNNNSWTITPTSGITLNNNGGAIISNTDSSTGTTQALILGTGTLTLADNLLVSNSGGSANTTGAIQLTSAIGGSGNVTFSNISTALSQTSSIRIQNGTANTFTGTVLVQKGTVTFNNSTAFGNSANAITLGQSGQGTAAILTTAGVTLANPITVASGSGGTLTIGGLNSGANTYSGTITLNGDVTLTSASSPNSTTFSNVVSGSGGITKAGTGNVTLSGNSSNTYTGKTVVNSGTLILGKTAGLNAISSTGASGADATNTDLQINSGGTVQLANSNQIADTTKLGLSGGTFNLNGKSEGSATVAGGTTTAATVGLGALTLSSNSTIDFGTIGTSSKLVFNGVDTHTASTVLAIANWEGIANTGSGSDQLIFAGATTDFTNLYTQSDVSFNGLLGYATIDFGNGFYEVTAVPEPGTWIGAALTLAAIGFTQRKRLRRSKI